MKPGIFAAIREFYNSKLPVINEENSENVSEADSEIVIRIKELLESKIR